jgi:hypothetical protein
MAESLNHEVSTENSGKNRGNVNNLVPHQFKPGESGNPGGRPKKRPITDYIIEQLEKPIPAAMKEKLPSLFTDVCGEDATFGQMLAFKLVTKAAKGDMKAMNAVLDRAEGKVRQNVGLSDANDDALTFRVLRVDI